MAKDKELDLTFDAPWADEDATDVPPHGALETLAAHLAARANVSVEEATRCLTALSAITGEQLGSHPNRWFVLPGIGAIQIVCEGARTKVNPFTKQPTIARATKRVAARWFGEVREAMHRAEFPKA
ncbi:MAG TPA: HU family DNA-binding protein [Tepidisphaeraceae bacterium]